MLYFYFMYFTCIGVLPACVSFGFPGTGITDSCELSYGCWELKLGSLEEQSVPVTAESSLQPLRIMLRCWIFCRRTLNPGAETLSKFLSLSSPLICRHGGIPTLSTEYKEAMTHSSISLTIRLCKSHHSTLSSQTRRVFCT